MDVHAFRGRASESTRTKSRWRSTGTIVFRHTVVMRVLWAVGGLLVSTSALADDVRFADAGETSITVGLSCDEAGEEGHAGHAVVAKGNFVFVACGAQGVAVYDAHDRSHPTFKGRFLYEHPCLDLTADGECLAERHVTSAPIVTDGDPKTIEEYEARKAKLNAARRAARINGESDADARASIASLREWARLHIHKRDPSLIVGGLVVLGVGGVSFIGGAVLVWVGLFGNCQSSFGFPACSGDNSPALGSHKWLWKSCSPCDASAHST